MSVIYYQNFESFSLGAAPPYGSFTGNANNATIIADNYLTSGSRACQTQANFSNITYYDGALYTSATMYVAWKPREVNNGASIEYWNGTGINFPNLITFSQEFDNTLSIWADNHGTFVANSGDVSYSLNQWNWFQINTTFLSISVGTGAPVLGIAYEMGLNGTSIMVGTVTTGKFISGMISGTPQFDRIVLENSNVWDEFTLSTLTSINTYPNPGTPAVRATTALIEPLELIDTAAIRATTGLIELVISDKNMHVQES